jgi:hypothetical protein
MLLDGSLQEHTWNHLFRRLTLGLVGTAFAAGKLQVTRPVFPFWCYKKFVVNAFAMTGVAEFSLDPLGVGGVSIRRFVAVHWV